MAAEEVGNKVVDGGSKQSLKRSLDDNLENSTHCDGHKSPKRSKLDDHPTSDETTPTVCDSSFINQNDSMEANIGDEDLDENLLNEISSLFDFKSSSSMAAMMWIEKRMGQGDDPRSILRNMSVDDKEIPVELDDATLWKIIASCVADPPRRSKLESLSTYEGVVDLIKKSSKIIVLTGAGVSVSCGIPDFRSRNGIYARLSVDYPDLPDPQAMFDIGYFKKNPKPFFKFAKEIYPGKFSPSISHFFIGALEKSGKLLRNYTQNIDTLEPSAGITRVIQCHDIAYLQGSFSSATCMTCKHKVDSEAIREDVMNQIVPRCPLCPTDCEFNILKPDIVFFGESLPEEFQQFDMDKEECDLLIVMGSSLIVRPVAIIPNVLPSHVPQVLINREPLPHMNFDVELLGDCDGIIQRLCHDLGEPFAEILKTAGKEHLLPVHEEFPITAPAETTSEESEACCSVTSNFDVRPPEESALVGSSSELQEGCDTTVSDIEANLSQPDSSTTLDDADTKFEVKNENEDSEVGCSASTNDESKQRTKRLLDIAKILEDKEFICLAPRKYVFHGAEISESTDSEWDSEGEEEDIEEEDGEEEEEGEGGEESLREVDDCEAEMIEASKLCDVPHSNGEGSTSNESEGLCDKTRSI